MRKIYKKITTQVKELAALVSLLLVNTAAEAGPVETWFGNISATFPKALMLITGAAYLTGAWFIWSALMMSKERTNNPGQIKVSSILITGLCGAAGIGLGVLGTGLVVQVFGSTGSGSINGFTSF